METFAVHAVSVNWQRNSEWALSLSIHCNITDSIVQVTQPVKREGSMATAWTGVIVTCASMTTSTASRLELNIGTGNALMIRLGENISWAGQQF